MDRPKKGDRLYLPGGSGNYAERVAAFSLVSLCRFLSAFFLFQFFIQSRWRFSEGANLKQLLTELTVGHVGKFIRREFRFKMNVVPHSSDSDVFHHVDGSPRERSKCSSAQPSKILVKQQGKST